MTTTHSAARSGGPARRRCRAAGLCLASIFALASCATGGNEEPSPGSPTAGTATVPADTPPASATAGTTATATASPTDSPRDPLGGPTQTYTTQSGIFTWTLPADWTVDVEEDLPDGDDSASGGIPYEAVEFSNPEDTVGFMAVTGLGPTDNDGWKPEIVEVIEAEELTDLPVAERGGEGGIGTGPVFVRTAISEITTEPPSREGSDGPGEVGDFGLEVQVVTVDAGADPMEQADYYSSWQYFLDPPEGAGEGAWGTSNVFSGGVDQEDAEEITGLKGEEAVRALLDTPEYAELRVAMASMQVELP